MDKEVISFDKWFDAQANFDFYDKWGDEDLVDIMRYGWEGCQKQMTDNIKPIIREMTAKQLVSYCETHHNGNYEEMKAIVIAKENGLSV